LYEAKLAFEEIAEAADDANEGVEIKFVFGGELSEDSLTKAKSKDRCEALFALPLGP
jgi:hypothetical protein